MCCESSCNRLLLWTKSTKIHLFNIFYYPLMTIDSLSAVLLSLSWAHLNQLLVELRCNVLYNYIHTITGKIPQNEFIAFAAATSAVIVVAERLQLNKL